MVPLVTGTEPVAEVSMSAVAPPSPRPDLPLVACPDCHEGYVGYARGEECPRCEGWGLVRAPLSSPVCPSAPLRVTLDDLRALSACAGDIAKFEATFGAHVDVTLESVGRAFEAEINVDWWAEKVFGSEYERVTAPAWAEYQRVTAQAMAKYERVTAPAIVVLADAHAASAVRS